MTNFFSMALANFSHFNNIALAGQGWKEISITTENPGTGPFDIVAVLSRREFQSRVEIWTCAVW
jgi:hypothetical protein